MHSYFVFDENSLTNYISDIQKIPTLSEDEEFELATKWKEKGEQQALNKIIASHLKLVVKIAKGYSGYGLSISDLIAEGNLGIMHAVQHFDPTIGYRFSTYAAWWIKSKIQEFVYNSWSIVKLSATKNNRKLFFNLRKIKKLLGIETTSDENIKKLAEKLEVSTDELITADNRLTHKDFSANSPIGEDGESSWQDFLVDANNSPDKYIAEQQEHQHRKNILHTALNTLPKKEHDIIRMHRLEVPPQTLQEIGLKLNISAERVRQLDKQAFLKIQKYIKSIDWENTPSQKMYGTLSCFFINVTI